MSRSPEKLAEQLQSRFGDALESCVVDLGEVTIEVPRGKLLEVALALREEDLFRFEQLIDLCGIDYASFGEGEWKTEEATGTGFSRGVNATTAGRMTQLDQELSVDGPPAARRFAAVYQLLSVSRNQRLRMRVFADDAELPVIPSVIEIWNSVNWYEREAFDLFGILFEGHPDLRRILTDYGFVGHPFRKDFPLTGNVEVRYDPEKQRVVYEPVSIEPRVLVPKVIRPETRGDASEPAAGSQD